VRKHRIGVAILIVWLGGCSSRATNRVVAHTPDDDEQDDSTMTRARFGTPVQVELQQDVDGYKTGTIERVRLRVVKSVWVGDFMVIEEGAEATGTATITTPVIGEDGEISVRADSVAGVTGKQIPLFGGYTMKGGVDCPFYWDCIRYLWTVGGYATIHKRTTFEAYVGAGVRLPNDALQSFMSEKFAETHRAIARCDHIASLQVYFLAEDAEPWHQIPGDEARTKSFSGYRAPVQKILLDGKEVGRLPPASVLTLIPSPGSHIISIKNNAVTFELKPCTPSYVRILKVVSKNEQSLALSLVGPDRGKYETRDLLEVRNRE
jgi:hypothetical protein